MDVITRVEKVQHRVILTVNDSEKISLPAGLFRERPMPEGTAFDLEEYEQWLLLHQYRYALDRAVGYLASRACSRGEIAQRLSRVGYRPQTIEMVLYKLEINGFLDDEAFARQWAESRAHKKLGKARIARELRTKGVSQEDTEAALESLNEETMLEDAVSLAVKALRRQTDEEPRKRAARVSQMLIRRGYDWETARTAVDRAMKDTTQE